MRYSRLLIGIFMLFGLFAFLNAQHSRYQQKDNDIAKIEIVKGVDIATQVAGYFVPDVGEWPPRFRSHTNCACHTVNATQSPPIKDNPVWNGTTNNLIEPVYAFIFNKSDKDITTLYNISITSTTRNLVLLC